VQYSPTRTGPSTVSATSTPTAVLTPAPTSSPTTGRTWRSQSRTTR
jgi:hypothetical protein